MNDYLLAAKEYYPVTDKTRMIYTTKSRVSFPVLRDSPTIEQVTLYKPGRWQKIIRYIAGWLGKDWGKTINYYLSWYRSINVDIDPQTGMGYNQECDILVVKNEQLQAPL